jgi:hypothetical protein
VECAALRALALLARARCARRGRPAARHSYSRPRPRRQARQAPGTEPQAPAGSSRRHQPAYSSVTPQRRLTYRGKIGRGGYGEN